MELAGFARSSVVADVGEALVPGGIEGLSDSPWQLPIDHLSATSLNMLQICPRQWQQRYILDRKEAPGQALILGSATHGGVEFGLDAKMVTQDNPPIDLVVAFFNDASWPKAIEDAGGTGEILWDGDPEDVRKQGAGMVALYAEAAIPRLEPAALEQKIEYSVPGVPVPIIGYLDIIQTEGRPSVDLKTSAKKRTTLKPDWRLQGRVYQLAIPKAVDWHVLTKAKTPQLFTGIEESGLMQAYNEVAAQQTKRHIRQLALLANHYFITYGPDEDWPALGVGHDWRCSWCAYKPDCPAWRES